MTLEQMNALVTAAGYTPAAGGWEDENKIMAFSVESLGPDSYGHPVFSLEYLKGTDELLHDNRPYAQQNPGGTGNTDDARELQVFIENDADLYRQQYTPILANLATKYAKGVYNHTLAVKLFMYLVESGAKKYTREFSGPGVSWHQQFDVPTRKIVAENLTRDFEVENELGNYSHLLPKKYQKQNPVPNGRSYPVRGVRPHPSHQFQQGEVVYIEGTKTKLGKPYTEGGRVYFPFRPPVEGTTAMWEGNIRAIAYVEESAGGTPDVAHFARRRGTANPGPHNIWGAKPFRLQAWSLEPDTGKWYPETVGRGYATRQEAIDQGNRYEDKGGLAYTVVDLQHDTLVAVGGKGMTLQVGRRLVSGSRSGYKVNPDASTHVGVRVYDDTGKLVGTLWQHLEPSEVEATLSEEGISTLADWSGIWEPHKPQLQPSYQFDVVTRKVNPDASTRALGIQRYQQALDTIRSVAVHGDIGTVHSVNLTGGVTLSKHGDSIRVVKSGASGGQVYLGSNGVFSAHGSKEFLRKYSPTGKEA